MLKKLEKILKDVQSSKYFNNFGTEMRKLHVNNSQLQNSKTINESKWSLVKAEDQPKVVFDELEMNQLNYVYIFNHQKN